MNVLEKLILSGCWMIAAVVGCSGKDTSSPSDDPTDADADTDSDSDTDTDADTDSDADTDTDARIGLLVVAGTAVADREGYAGAEEWTFLADAGYGELLCHIRYGLGAPVPRTDCPVCDWAYDLTISDAVVLLDEQSACQAAMGVDATTVLDWNGTTRSYGYNPEYIGHAEVLMQYEEDNTWRAFSYADYDEETSTLNYEQVDGEHAY
jgi:hypothetical protein